MEEPMPENPDNFDQFISDELTTADSRMAQVPIGVLRNLHRDAKAYRREHGHEQGGQPGSPALTPEQAANVAAGLSPEGDVILQDGEADLTQTRRELTSNAPPDRPVIGDVYKEAAEIQERVEQQGGKHLEGWAAGFAHIVQSVIRGNRQAVLRESPGRGVRGEG
jgi:hypothetical protein